jgi:hypothetical protein
MLAFRRQKENNRRAKKKAEIIDSECGPDLNQGLPQNAL